MHIVAVSVALAAPPDDRAGMVGEIIWNLRQADEGFVYGTYDAHAILQITTSAEAGDPAAAGKIVNDRVVRAVRDSGFEAEPGWFVHDPAHRPVFA